MRREKNKKHKTKTKEQLTYKQMKPTSKIKSKQQQMKTNNQDNTHKGYIMKRMRRASNTIHLRKMPSHKSDKATRARKHLARTSTTIKTNRKTRKRTHAEQKALTYAEMQHITQQQQHKKQTQTKTDN